MCVPDLEGTIYVGSAHNLVKDIVYGTIHLKYIGNIILPCLTKVGQNCFGQDQAAFET